MAVSLAGEFDACIAAQVGMGGSATYHTRIGARGKGSVWDRRRNQEHALAIDTQASGAGVAHRGMLPCRLDEMWLNARDANGAGDAKE